MPRRRVCPLVSAIAGVVLLPCGFAAAQAIPAFPGADGAAAYVTGGRATTSGGIVYHVTKTNSAIDDPQRNDPGTIRYGLNNVNFPAGVPRTIVFDVGGVFNLGRLPQPANNWDPNGNGWDAQSRLTIGGTNITLAGQTAPGPGVIFMGGGLKPQGNNNIIRNITVASGYGMSGWQRPGDPMPPSTDFPDSVVYDAMDLAGTNLMIDHVSTLYATDETISLNEVANHVTVQYSSMSQGQNYPQNDAEGGGYTGHALGSLIQPGSDAKISFHHNLYAHQKGRMPRVGSEIGTGAHNDFRNNVFYNWLGTAGTGASGQPSFNKFVGNFYLAGPGGDNPVGGSSTAVTTASGGTSIFNGSNSTGTRIYHFGNLKDVNKDGDALDGAALANSDFGSSAFVSDASFAVPYFGITDSAAAAYGRVLDYMGANWWNRGAADARIVNEVRTGMGKIMAWADDPFNADPNEGTEWRAIKNTPAVARAADWDVEPSIGYGAGDGMPTWWEVMHGLNSSARDDAGDFDNDGYTNLEEYLNEIAEWPAPVPLVFSGATNARYEQITNWHIPWQPSKYDEARVLDAAVTINSVGQHARVLKVAPDAGNTGTVTLSAGWIDIAERLEVANGGQFIVAGGALLVPHVQLSGSALLALTPGGGKRLTLQSLAIGDSARLDLGDNALVITGGTLGSWNGSAYTGTTGLIDAGRLVTTMPDATADNPLTALGVARAGDIGRTDFAGRSVQPDDVLILYTFAGDANLDGKINIDDYGRIDSNVGTPGANGWANGDFNYDGKINIDDYGIIDSNISRQSDPAGAGAGGDGGAGVSIGAEMGAGGAAAAVPEPSCIAWAALAALLVRRRVATVS